MDNSDYQSCLITANTDITFFSCNLNAYAYKTVDLLSANSTLTSASQFNLTNPTLPLSAVRKSFEINKLGSITYFNQSSNIAYRMSLAANGIIIQEQLLTISQSVIGSSGVTVNDILITRDMILVYFSNNTFYAFNRPQTTPLTLTTPRSAKITYSSVNTLTFDFLNLDSTYQNFYVYSSPNYNSQANVIYQHLITPKYTNGVISDVTITLQNTYQVADLQMNDIEFTANIIGIGCSSCNSYNGRVEFYDRTSFTQLAVISGTGSNLQMGQVLASVDNGLQVIFYVSTSTSGSLTSRYSYVTAILFQKYYQNSSYGYESLFQIVKNVAPLPQNGLYFSVASSNLIIKYPGNKGIFSALTCFESQYYQASDNTCQSCSNSAYPFQLAIQSTACNQCSDIWYAEQKKQSTSYYDAIYSTSCQSFDPKTLPDYANYTNGGSGGNTGTGSNNGSTGGGNGNGGNTGGDSQNNSTSSTDSSGGISGGAIAGIVVGILVVILIIAIGGYCYYKKKHGDEKQSKETLERREKKKKEKLEKTSASANNSKSALNAKKKADELSKRILRKMENEQQVYEEVKDKDGKKKQNNDEAGPGEKAVNNSIKTDKVNISFNNSKAQNNQSAILNANARNKFENPQILPPQSLRNAARIDLESGSQVERPMGEVLDLKSVNIDFSEEDSGDIDEGSDGNSDISQERGEPERINNINNHQHLTHLQNDAPDQKKKASQPLPNQVKQVNSNVSTTHNSNNIVVNPPPQAVINKGNKGDNDSEEKKLNSSNNAAMKTGINSNSNSQPSSEDKNRLKADSSINMISKAQPQPNAQNKVQNNNQSDQSADYIDDDDDSFTDSEDDEESK